jgi:hypothetical protein
MKLERKKTKIFFKRKTKGKKHYSRNKTTRLKLEHLSQNLAEKSRMDRYSKRDEICSWLFHFKMVRDIPVIPGETE